MAYKSVFKEGYNSKIKVNVQKNKKEKRKEKNKILQEESQKLTRAC